MMPYLSPRVLVDQTHCGRHVTGLERITLELFSPEALAPLDVHLVRASGRRSMMLRQTFGLPAAVLRDRTSLVLCPGFPPSPLLTLFGRDRVVPYIHDLFLLTRPQDLNRRAKLYMVAPFRLVVRRAKLFLVNSETTAAELRRFCRPQAEILLYRPKVRNVFDVDAAGRADRTNTPGHLRLIAVGTVEPRKNLSAAVAILAALRASSHPHATLDIVGRPGWGVDIERLAAMPGVTVHGYQSAERVRKLMEEADALISTAHDEGLGLPLLEAQYGGLPVITPDRPVFREVLGQSGIILADLDPERAAAQLSVAFAAADWRAVQAQAAASNVQRWNTDAESDRSAVVARLQRLAASVAAAS